MKFNLFKKKSFNDNKKKNNTNQRPKVNSPSQSISSLSSSQSSLQTIHDYQQETRGIFRTLEPVWSFLPTTPHQQQWIQLKDHHQKLLENAFHQQLSTCTIDLMGNQSPMIIHFNATPPSMSPKKNNKNKNSNDQHFLNHDPIKSLPMKKKRPVTQLFVPNHQQQHNNKSSPNLLQSNHHSLQQQQQQPQYHYQENHYYLNYNLRRALVPYWWFEQDNDQGFKGMCRFDQKNQVRLEALSDDRSTLTLTDIAFPIPFQVVLEPADRSSREEWRGFMYLNHHLSVVHPPSPPLLKQHLHQNMFHTSPTSIMINDHLYLDQNDPDDVFYNHDIFLNRRSSI